MCVCEGKTYLVVNKFLTKCMCLINNKNYKNGVYYEVASSMNKKKDLELRGWSGD